MLTSPFPPDFTASGIGNATYLLAQYLYCRTNHDKDDSLHIDPGPDGAICGPSPRRYVRDQNHTFNHINVRLLLTVHTPLYSYNSLVYYVLNSYRSTTVGSVLMLMNPRLHWARHSVVKWARLLLIPIATAVLCIHNIPLFLRMKIRSTITRLHVTT